VLDAVDGGAPPPSGFGRPETVSRTARNILFMDSLHVDITHFLGPDNNFEAPNRACRHARALAGGGHGCALRVPRAPGGDSMTAVWGEVLVITC
jgi:hypothetical protein